jgi:hypothetical protein
VVRTCKHKWTTIGFWKSRSNHGERELYFSICEVSKRAGAETSRGTRCILEEKRSEPWCTKVIVLKSSRACKVQCSFGRTKGTISRKSSHFWSRKKISFSRDIGYADMSYVIVFFLNRAREKDKASFLIPAVLFCRRGKSFSTCNFCLMVLS